MVIKEISKDEFNSFSKTHILSSFYQTKEYGTVMSRNGYQDIYVGAFEDDNMIGASLVLTKSISLNVKYGYAPRGFLVDYFNEEVFTEFSKQIKKFFKKRGYAFIKIDPLITYSEVNPHTNTKNINEPASKLYSYLEKNDYKRLKNNVYFESMLTKYNPILNLKNFSFSNLDEKIQKKLDKIHSRGLRLIKGDIYNINDLYELIKRKNDRSSDYYKILYKVFKESDMIDLFLVEVDYHNYLENLQDEYATELSINERINNVFKNDTKNKDVYKEKMDSDRKLNDINKEIGNINLKIQNSIYKEIIAGALVIKYNGVASIYVSGFNKSYNSLLPNHFLHYMLITTYQQEGFNYLDLNGMAGDFSKDSPYKGLNDFKMIWNPRVYEYLGEFDFILSYTKYSLLWTTKQLHKEFERSPRVI